MSFPWVPCVLCLGFTLVATSSAIRPRCAQFLSSAIPRGSASRGERIAKYHRLIEIERELGSKAPYAGAGMYERWKHSVKA